MALPPHLAKALEQTKMNLHMLYGAAYFTEKQWMNIDYWINKEKYLWTGGPQQTIFEEELLVFDEPTETSGSIPEPANTNLLSSKAQDVVTISEIGISSSAFLDLADTPDHTPNSTSAEGSSDDEPTIQAHKSAVLAPNTVSEPPPMETTEIPRRQPAQVPATGGLPLGITQAQLDEAKSFKASWAIKYDSAEPISSRKGRRNPASDSEAVQSESGYPSPSTSDEKTQIMSWASGVNKSKAPSPVPIKILANPLAKSHGRESKPVDDSTLKPSALEFRPRTARPSSRASTLNWRPVNPTKISAGMIFKARFDQKKLSTIALEVRKGDILKVYAFVSGQTWSCENIHTKLRGQVHANIFDIDELKGDRLLKEQPLADKAARQRAPSQSTVRSYGVDGFEQSNAAEWDDVSVASRTKTVGSVPKPKIPDGLAASRFAVLADLDLEPTSSNEGEEQKITMSRDQVSDIVEAKIAEILAGHKNQNFDNVLSRAPSRAGGQKYSRVPAKEPSFVPPPPKTVTCWFWHMQQNNPHKDGCRYKDEDCFNLHFYPNGAANASFPLNKDGNPTWAALSDAEQAEVPSHKKPLTCWYWATRGHCSNSADACKYMHANAGYGVAPRPRSFRQSFSSSRDTGEGHATWDPTENDSTMAGDGLEEQANQTPGPEVFVPAGWETEEDTRPDFVKELEEKAEIQALDIW